VPLPSCRIVLEIQRRRELTSTVAIVRCRDYSKSNVSTAIREAVDLLGGIENFVQPANRVLLKPNLLSPRKPEASITTHPAVIEVIAELIHEVGAKSFIGDSPASTSDSAEAYRNLLNITGMLGAAANSGAETVRFDDSGVVHSVSEAIIFRNILLSGELDAADVLINVPKLKTHELTRITGAVKNLFGCVPGRRKVEFHLQAGTDSEQFAQILVDILREVRPAISIMDAVIGMEGQGPAAGQLRDIGLIIASADPVALDAVVCMIIGLDPFAVPTLKLAHEQGVGIASPEQISVVGTPIEQVRIADFKLPPRCDALSRVPKPIYKLLRNQFTRSPHFIREKCSGCKACAEICPVKAISGKGTKLKIDYSKCIRCYCCQEICPNKAISLHTGWLRRRFNKLLD